jgi:hypothetical protein
LNEITLETTRSRVIEDSDILIDLQCFAESKGVSFIVRNNHEDESVKKDPGSDNNKRMYTCPVEDVGYGWDESIKWKSSEYNRRPAQEVLETPIPSSDASFSDISAIPDASNIPDGSDISDTSGTSDTSDILDTS